MAGDNFQISWIEAKACKGALAITTIGRCLALKVEISN
jgi:hypothetical protein